MITAQMRWFYMQYSVEKIHLGFIKKMFFTETCGNYKDATNLEEILEHQNLFLIVKKKPGFKHTLICIIFSLL